MYPEATKESFRFETKANYTVDSTQVDYSFILSEKDTGAREDIYTGLCDCYCQSRGCQCDCHDCGFYQNG